MNAPPLVGIMIVFLLKVYLNITQHLLSFGTCWQSMELIPSVLPPPVYQANPQCIELAPSVLSEPPVY